MRSQSGVTLVELVVILVIIAIMSVAVYASLGNVLQVTASKGASEQVAASIRLARSGSRREEASARARPLGSCDTPHFCGMMAQTPQELGARPPHNRCA